MEKWTNKNPFKAPARVSRQVLRDLYKAIGVDFDGLSLRQRAVLRAKQAIVLVTGGVRAGKSFCCALKLFTLIVVDFGQHRIEPGAQYWLVGNNYRNTEWEYRLLKKWFKALGWVQFASKDERDARIEFSICPLEECADRRNRTGARCDHLDDSPVFIRTVSSENLDNIASIGVQAIVACEGAQMSQEAFERCQERCFDEGAQLIVSGTMDRLGSWYVELIQSAEGDEEYQREKGMFCITIPSLDNKHSFPGGEDDPDYLGLKSRFTKDKFEVRILGKIRPAEQIIFGREFNSKVHIAEEELEVDYFNMLYLTHDPSYSRPGALLVCQLEEDGGKNKTLKIIDEIYTTSVMTSEVIDMVRRKSWYNYMKSYNRIKVTGDPALKQHSHDKSGEDLWKIHTGLPVELPPKSSPTVQIQWVRELLRVIPSQPPFLLISPRCRGILSEFGHCPNPLTGQAAPYEYKFERETNLLTDEPIDQNNHSIKALAYLLFILKFAGHSSEFLKAKPLMAKKSSWMKQHRSESASTKMSTIAYNRFG